MAHDGKAKEDGNDKPNFPKDLVRVEIITSFVPVGKNALWPSRWLKRFLAKISIRHLFAANLNWTQPTSGVF